MTLAKLPHEPPLPLCRIQSPSTDSKPLLLFLFIKSLPGHLQVRISFGSKARISGGHHRCTETWGHRLFATGIGNKCGPMGHERGHGGLNTSEIHLQLCGRDWNQWPWRPPSIHWDVLVEQLKSHHP